MTIMFFIVYAGFIVWMSFLIPPAMFKLSGARIAQRNPEWLRTQPALADRLRRRTLPVGLAWLAGTGLLVALGFAAFASRPLEAMTLVLIASLLVSVLFIFGEAWSHWRLTRAVPAPAKREADLRSTRHEEHAPTRSTRVWYALLVAALALYGYAYLAELLPAGQAVARMSGIGGIVLLSLFANRQARRQPAEPVQQKLRIGVMVFCLAIVASRIAQDFFAAPQFNEIWFWFFFALSIQALFGVATVHAIRQARAGRPGSATAPNPGP